MTDYDYGLPEGDWEDEDYSDNRHYSKGVRIARLHCQLTEESLLCLKQRLEAENAAEREWILSDYDASDEYKDECGKRCLARERDIYYLDRVIALVRTGV